MLEIFIFLVIRFIHEPLAWMIGATPYHVLTLINWLIDWLISENRIYFIYFYRNAHRVSVLIYWTLCILTRRKSILEELYKRCINHICRATIFISTCNKFPRCLIFTLSNLPTLLRGIKTHITRNEFVSLIRSVSSWTFSQICTTQIKHEN